MLTSMSRRLLLLLLCNYLVYGQSSRYSAKLSVPTLSVGSLVDKLDTANYMTDRSIYRANRSYSADLLSPSYGARNA